MTGRAMNFIKRNIGFIILVGVALSSAAFLGFSWYQIWADTDEIRKKVKGQQDFFEQVKRIPYSLNQANEKITEGNRALADAQLKGLITMLATKYGIPAEAAGQVECKRIVLDVLRKLKKDLAEKNVAGQGDSSGFSFDSIARSTTLPPIAEVPMILKNLRIVEEAIRLIGKAGLSDLRTITRQQGLKGLDRDLYTLYPLELSVAGNFTTINRFVNMLQRESKGLFVVRSVSLESRDQAAGGVVATVAPAAGGPGAGMGSPTGAPGDMAMGMRPPVAPRYQPKAPLKDPKDPKSLLLPDDKKLRLAFTPHEVSAVIIVDFVDIKKTAEEN